MLRQIICDPSATRDSHCCQTSIRPKNRRHAGKVAIRATKRIEAQLQGKVAALLKTTGSFNRMPHQDSIACVDYHMVYLSYTLQHVPALLGDTVTKVIVLRVLKDIRPR